MFLLHSNVPMHRSNSLGALIEHLLVNPQGGITERVWTVCASSARCCRWDHGMTAKASAVSIGSELLLFHCICFLFWEDSSRSSAKSCFTRKATDTTNEHLGGSFPRFSGSSRGQQWYSHMYFSYLVFGALRTLRGWFASCLFFNWSGTEVKMFSLTTLISELFPSVRICEAERQGTSVRANFWLYPSSALSNPKAVRRRPSPQWTLD